jgi:hypothetical protein
VGDLWFGRIVVILSTIFGSTGLWAYVQSKSTRRSATARLLMGMAYEQIVGLGTAYLDRGWISRDELEELRRYFYDPYKELGGNGVAERVMNQVDLLPLRSQSPFVDALERRAQTLDEGFNNNVRVVRGSGQEAPVE